MRPHRLTLSFASALVLSSCGSDGPSRPSPPPPLRSTPVSSRIVELASAPTSGYRPRGGPVLIQFENDSLYRAGDYEDIAIRYVGDVPSVFDTLEIYNYDIPDWQPIGATFPLTPLRIGADFVWTGAERLSSQVDAADCTSFLVASGRLLLKTLAEGGFSARLVRYSDDYNFVTLRLEGLVWHSSMFWRSGRLYVSSGYTVRDSLIAYEESGERIWAIDYEPGFVTSTAFDGEHVWAYVPSESRIHKIDTTGNSVGTLVAALDSVDAMVWADETLWYVGGDNSNRGYLYRIDLDSSYALGAVVAEPKFRITSQHIRAIATDSAGFIAVVAAAPIQVLRVSFGGVARDSYECNAAAIDAVAWDGGSLWTLHHGTPEVMTDATLLTRFTLE